MPLVQLLEPDVDIYILKCMCQYGDNHLFGKYKSGQPLPSPLRPAGLGWLLRHSPKRPLASRRPVGPSGRSR